MATTFRISWHYFGDMNCLLTSDTIGAELETKLSDPHFDLSAAQDWDPSSQGPSPYVQAIRELDSIKRRKASPDFGWDHRWTAGDDIDKIRVLFAHITLDGEPLDEAVLTPDTLYRPWRYGLDAVGTESPPVRLEVDRIEGSYILIDRALSAGDHMVMCMRKEVNRSNDLRALMGTVKGPDMLLGRFDNVVRSEGAYSWQTWVEHVEGEGLRIVLGSKRHPGNRCRDDGHEIKSLDEEKYVEYPCGAFGPDAPPAPVAEATGETPGMGA